MKRFAFIYSVLITALFCACSKDIAEDQQQTSGSIVGSVADKTTGEPVPTVNVRIAPGGNSTVTGSDGTFSFLNLLDEEEYVLYISKDGYKSTNSDKVLVLKGVSTSVHLLIERIPSIVTADRDLLDFGENAGLNTLSFNIVNTSYEDLEWEIEERSEWITEIKPQMGILKYGKTEAIVVVIDRDKLDSGLNEAVIVLRSSNGSSEIKITATGSERYVPKLNTLDATDITSSSAKFNGEIIDAGIPEYSERGFVYSLTSMPTIDNAIAKLTSSVTKDKKYSYTLNGLSIGETYYVRAYAKNSVGIAYSSNEIKFTTKLILPEVETLDIIDADIQGGTATFRGVINSVGKPAYTERGFVYGTMPEPTIYDNKVATSGVGVDGAYSIYMKDLPTSTYYMRAYAINQGGVSYGETKMVELEWVDLKAAGISVQKNDIGVSDWVSVNSMCENSTLGGYTDWRLPTQKELMTLYVNKDYIGNFTTTSYSNKHLYWSSSDDNNYYYIRFSDGHQGYFVGPSYNCSARCVRTINQ